MEDKGGSESIVDQAISAAPPTVPPPPTIETRSSIPHLLLGNLVLILSILAGSFDILSWWIVIVLEFGLFAALNRFDPTENIKNQFRAARKEEIEELFNDHSDVRNYIEKELPTSLNTSPSVDVVAVPTAVLTLVVVPVVFIDINNSLEWIWILRWPVAAGGAALVWIITVLLWSIANLTPAKKQINYMEVREEEAQANKLGAADQNDIHIIRQIANLDSLHKRIDTYTLESALLSALSFSSFMAIVLSEQGYITQLPKIFTDPLPWRSLDRPLELPVVGQVQNYPSMDLAYLHAHLISLISLSLLLCATMFLGVLVARLRFNDGYRDAESLLKVAERLNEKEEKALEGHNQERALIYLQSIDALLRSATSFESTLSISVAHMRYSRNAGIVFFVVALIMCGMLFHGGVAIGIATLFIAAMVIGYFDRFLRRVQSHEVFSQGLLGTLLRPFRRA